MTPEKATDGGADVKLPYWSVTVSIDGRSVLTIEPNCLAGISDIDAYDEPIREAARHLMAFIGDGESEPFLTDDDGQPETSMPTADVKLDPKGLKSAVEAASELACDGGAPVHDYVSGIITAYLRSSPAAGEVEGEPVAWLAQFANDLSDEYFADEKVEIRRAASAIESLQRREAEALTKLTHAEAKAILQERRARRMEEALREALHVLQQIPDRQRSKRHKCAIGKARAALSDSPAAEPVAGQGEAVTDDAVIRAGDVLMQHGLNAPEQVIYQAARAALEAALRPAPGVVVKPLAWLCTYIPTGDVEAVIDEAAATMRSEMLIDGEPVWIVKNLYAAPFTVSDDDPDFTEPEPYLPTPEEHAREAEEVGQALYRAERAKESK